MPETVIDIKGLEFSYGKGNRRVDALNNIDLKVLKGEIFGFIGPNGAGKTTTIKHLIGIIPSDPRNVTVLGESPSRLSVRAHIGYMPEIANYHTFLSPVEILFMYGNICGIKRSVLKARVEQLIDIAGLAGSGKKRLSSFSKGMTQKLSFAQALINDPEVLILDEPTSGLDPVARKNMREVILRLRDQGKTIFFSSHELSEVELVADRIGIIHKGSMVRCGKVPEMVENKAEGQTLESYFLEIVGENR